MKKTVAAALLAFLLTLAAPFWVQGAGRPVRTLTMDTRSYVMAPGDIYDFRAAVAGPGLSQDDVKVYASRDGISPVARVPGTDKYRITGHRLGTSYVFAEINGVHASIRVTVERRPAGAGYGESCRAVSVIGYETEAPQNGELRAVWVPYLSLDLSAQADRSESAFRRKFDAIVAKAKNSGMNALFVHVRPFGDALYPSQQYPWSHLLTGTQGKHPGYDPLAYMVEAAHREGLELHAWINPLRIRQGSTPASLAAGNPYVQWQSDSARRNWTMAYQGSLYYNPGYAQVRDYIVEGVREIVSRYDVDGIHFDDYFYPTQDAALDAAAYRESGTSLPVAQWRKQNINLLVQAVYRAVKEENPEAVFGISPQASLANNEAQAADVQTWASRAGYVDYLAPQIYFPFSHASLPFTRTAEQWRSLVTAPGVDLYLGLGLYKAGSQADGGAWLGGGPAVARQIEQSRALGAQGFALYSWDYLDHPQTREEMQAVRQVLEKS